MGGKGSLTPEWLFAYGTLRRRGGAAELLGGAESGGPARYRGRLYDLGSYPGAVASDDPADAVQGELYRLPDGEGAALLARLDRYEGPEFRRVRARVTRSDGAPCECWIYTYAGELAGLRRIESGDFLSS